MALRLAGEPFLAIQGADKQGWVREITAQDALPGLKINQQGTGRVFDFQDGGVSKLYLPDGGDVSLVGSLVFDLANDVTITPANPAAPRTLTIPAVGGNRTFVFLEEEQTFTAAHIFTTVQGTDTTDATSITAAAMETAGGLAVAKKTFTGDLVQTEHGKQRVYRPTDTTQFGTAQAQHTYTMRREFVRAFQGWLDDGGVYTLAEFSVPAESTWWLLEVTALAHRVGLPGNVRIERALWSVGRQASGANVVLTSITTAGEFAHVVDLAGGQSADVIALTLERSAAEANTEPQLIRIRATIRRVGSSQAIRCVATIIATGKDIPDVEP